MDLYAENIFSSESDRVEESPEFRHLNDRVLRTVDPREQETLIREMEWLASEQAYFPFLYQPIDLVAVKKTVTCMPYPTFLILAEAAVGGRGQ